MYSVSECFTISKYNCILSQHYLNFYMYVRCVTNICIWKSVKCLQDKAFAWILIVFFSLCCFYAFQTLPSLQNPEKCFCGCVNRLGAPNFSYDEKINHFNAFDCIYILHLLQICEWKFHLLLDCLWQGWSLLLIWLQLLKASVLYCAYAFELIRKWNRSMHITAQQNRADCNILQLGCQRSMINNYVLYFACTCMVMHLFICLWCT